MIRRGRGEAAPAANGGDGAADMVRRRPDIFERQGVAAALEIGYAQRLIPTKIHIFKEKGAS